MLHFAKWKTILVIAVSVLGLLLPMPNVLTEETRASLPNWLPANALNLGLDLRGGAHVAYEVDQKLLFDDLSESLVDQIRSSLRSTDRTTPSASVI